MLKAIGFIIKLAAFASLVLVVGHWAKWDGQTLSQHVRNALDRAERSSTAAKVRELTRSIAQDAREGAERKRGSKLATRSRSSAPAEDRASTTSSAPARSGADSQDESEKERILSSERQKLRDLIRELNSSNR